MSDKQLQDWLKRTKKKGPFYLYSTKPTKKGFQYTILFIDKAKVKIGVLEDGMFARYGIKTFGTLSSSNPTGLWQSGPGAVSEDQLKEMIALFNDESTLDEFNVDDVVYYDW